MVPPMPTTASCGSGLKTRAALRIRLRALGAEGVVRVRLAAGPAGDGVLELVEDADVELVGRALLAQEVGEAVLVVFLVGEFKNGFA